MKTYVRTTCAIFALILGAHIWRFAAEGKRLFSEPVFILTTFLAASLFFWGLRLGFAKSKSQ